MKRVIKPWYCKWAILFSLYRAKGLVSVYHVIPMESGFDNIHKLIVKLHNEGLLIYFMDYRDGKEVVKAKITNEGKEWLFKRILIGLALSALIIVLLIALSSFVLKTIFIPSIFPFYEYLPFTVVERALAPPLP